MSWPLTFEEVRELRQRARRCLSCGRPLPDRDTFVRRCFRCGWLDAQLRSSSCEAAER